VLDPESPEEVKELGTVLEEKGLRLIGSKTKIIVYNFRESNREIDRTRHSSKKGGYVVCKVNRFKYLGSVVQRNGGFVEDVRNRIMSVNG